jgi:hypothetical protein
MAYELIKRLQAKGLTKILLQLKKGLTEEMLSEDKSTKVFEDSFDANPQNCVRGKCQLVEHWEDYEHSSARFYVKNKLDGFLPLHYEELSSERLRQ